MYASKFLRLYWILGVMSLKTLIPGKGATRFQGEDYSRDEKLLYEYYQYENKLEWIWSGKPFCRILRRRGMSVTTRPRYNFPDLIFNYEYVQTREILLEAEGCLKLEVQILVCLYQSRRPGRNILYARQTNFYLHGLNGEIYSLVTAAGICDDLQTPMMSERVVGISNSAIRSSPKLWGIARIFRAINAIRSARRQWNRDRISGRIVNTDDENEEYFRQGELTIFRYRNGGNDQGMETDEYDDTDEDDEEDDDVDDDDFDDDDDDANGDEDEEDDDEEEDDERGGDDDEGDDREDNDGDDDDDDSEEDGSEYEGSYDGWTIRQFDDFTIRMHHLGDTDK